MRDEVTTPDEMNQAEQYAALDNGVLPAWQPVPVVVTQPVPVHDQPARSFVAGQSTITAARAQVISKHVARLSLHLRNVGTANLYLGQDSFIATASSGYVLPPGSALVVDSTHDVWVGTDELKATDGTPGGTGRLAWLQTLADG